MDLEEKEPVTTLNGIKPVTTFNSTLSTSATISWEHFSAHSKCGATRILDNWFQERFEVDQVSMCQMPETRHYSISTNNDWITPRTSATS